jgi:hypothetical protein
MSASRRLFQRPIRVPGLLTKEQFNEASFCFRGIGWSVASALTFSSAGPFWLMSIPFFRMSSKQFDWYYLKKYDHEKAYAKYVATSLVKVQSISTPVDLF